MALNIQAQPSPKWDGNGTLATPLLLFRPETPQTKPILPDVSQSFTSIVQIALNVLVNPDEAYRADRQAQEQMMHDPVVMGPLQKRLLATAKLEYEVVPEDVDDPYQVEVAAEIEKIVRDIPRWQELVRNLGFAVLRGTAAVELNWVMDEMNRNWAIDGHRPYHGDKITFDIYGNPRILTRQYQTGGRELDASEKDRLMIHVHDREDGEFYQGAQAGYVFKGRGLRDIIWPYWFIQRNALKLWTMLLDKYANGWVIGKYPLGNASAKAAIESVLQNLLSGSNVSVPVPQGADQKDVYGIEVLKMEGTGEAANMFMDFVENYCGKHIRIVIEGQQQAQQEGGDGLGSERANKLADMFTMYRDYDAGLIEDTLTESLVGRIQWFNYGQLPFKCKFRFVLDSKDYDQQAKRVEAAQKTGLAVPKSWVYDSLDIPQLNGDESPDEIIDFGGGMQLPGQPAPGRIFATNADPAASEPLFQTSSIASHQPSEYRQLFGGVMDSGKPIFTGE